MAIKPQIETVTVLGTAGMLGSQIAYQTAYSGLSVTAYDISEELLDSAKHIFESLAAIYEQEVEGAAGGSARDALGRIHGSADLGEAVRDADLVIESIPERLDLKREVYTRLGLLAPERTIFATNTSMLLPSELASSTGRPDRFLAMHSPTRSGSRTPPRSWAIPAPTRPSTGPSSTLRGGSAWCRSRSAPNSAVTFSTRC